MIKKILTKEIEDRIERLQEQLKGYCHHEDCGRWWGCPVNHSLCKEGLGLDTAIAWEMESELDTILATCYNHSDSSVDLKKSYYMFNVLYDIVRYHKTRYSKLYSLIDQAENIIFSLEERAKELNGNDK